MVDEGFIIIEEVNYYPGSIIISDVPANAIISTDHRVLADIYMEDGQFDNKKLIIDESSLNSLIDTIGSPESVVHISEVNSDDDFPEFPLSSHHFENWKSIETHSWKCFNLTTCSLLLALIMSILFAKWIKGKYRWKQRGSIKDKPSATLDLTSFVDSEGIMLAVTNHPDSLECSMKKLVKDLLENDPKNLLELTALASKIKSSKAVLDHIAAALRNEFNYCKEIGDIEGEVFLTDLACKTWEYHHNLLESISKFKISRNQRVHDVMMKTLESSEISDIYCAIKLFALCSEPVELESLHDHFAKMVEEMFNSGIERLRLENKNEKLKDVHNLSEAVAFSDGIIDQSIEIRGITSHDDLQVKIEIARITREHDVELRRREIDFEDRFGSKKIRGFEMAESIWARWNSDDHFEEQGRDLSLLRSHFSGERLAESKHSAKTQFNLSAQRFRERCRTMSIICTLGSISAYTIALTNFKIIGSPSYFLGQIGCLCKHVLIVENIDVRYLSCNEKVPILRSSYDYNTTAFFERTIWGSFNAFLMPNILGKWFHFLGDYGACLFSVLFRVFWIILFGWIVEKMFARSGIAARFHKLSIATSYAYWASILFLVLDYLQSYFQESKAFFVTLALQMWLPQVIFNVCTIRYRVPNIRYKGRKQRLKLQLSGAAYVIYAMISIALCIYASWCWGHYSYVNSGI